MQGIFQKENTDKALKYGIYRHLPTYEKIIRNLVSFYIKNATINGKAIDAMDIARYLQGIVADFMDYELHMKRAMADYKDNIDNSLYCIIMRYNAKGSDYRSRFY